MAGEPEIYGKVFEGVVDTLAETNKLLMETVWEEDKIMAGHPKKGKRIRRKGKKRR